MNRHCATLSLRLLPVLFLAGMMLLWSAASAVAKTDGVQRWAQSKAVMEVDPKGLAGPAAAGQVNITDISSDIRFDPRELDDSSIAFSATILPTRLPGRRTIDERAQRAAAAVFQSEKIRQRDETTFEVIGFFKMNNVARQVIFPLTVSYGGTAQDAPALVFDAAFAAPVGKMAPELGLPVYLPLRLSITAVPAP